MTKLVAALLAVSVLGCEAGGGMYYGHRHHDDYYDPYPLLCEDGVTEATIDEGALLELEPGEGVGVTVEATGPGTWRVAVACDTYLSGYPCTWDVLASSVDGQLYALEGERLEANDVLEWYPSVEGSRDADAARLFSRVDYDLDAFTIEADPGAGLRIDVLLDGDCGGPYLLWSEYGSVVTSATLVTDLFPVIWE